MLLLLLACHRDEAPGLCAAEAQLSVTDAGLTWELADCASLTLEPTLLGEGDLSLRLELVDGALVPTVTAGAEGGHFEALSLSGPLTLAGASAPRIWKQGYQSWWWSGVAELDTLEFTAQGLPLTGGDESGSAATEETPATSWWLGLLGRPDGASLLLGALAATQTKFYTAFTEDQAWAVWGGRGERIPLAPGESLTLDPLWVQASADAWQLHRTYAQAVADYHVLPPPPSPPPSGWSSWTVSYEDLSEDLLRANLDAAIAQNAAGDLAPLQLFQIDDGWERAWGDWTANPQHPSGMAGIAAQIHEAGLRPGLWMAPFYVEASTGLVDAHPDWFVRDADGVPLSYANFGDHDYRVLDVTHPEAAAWLSEQIAARVAEGFTYLKLDFLYAGAQEGQRYEDVSGMQAFQRGMTLLREAAGPDTWILACGAPMLPSVGFVQSFRSGADIAFNFDPDPRLEYLRWQARATAARGWQNGLWWWIDADSILLRAPFDAVTGSGAVVANLASGGPWLLGDDLSTLDQDRLALALHPEAAALRGQLVRPASPLDFPSGPDVGPLGELGLPNDQVPTVWTLEDGTTLLLNMNDHSVSVEGPGGRELLSGVSAQAGTRTLAAGQGEIWVAR